MPSVGVLRLGARVFPRWAPPPLNYPNGGPRSPFGSGPGRWSRLRRATPALRFQAMRVAILPSGALLADTAPVNDEASDGLSATARARVARAFGRGPGHALLDLGATELDAPLVPPLAFLRDLGRAFVTRLCAMPDLEERRERIEVDCPTDERARLAGAVPPMDGGEYVDADWVAARWADLNRAFADEIRAPRARLRRPRQPSAARACVSEKWLGAASGDRRGTRRGIRGRQRAVSRDDRHRIHGKGALAPRGGSLHGPDRLTRRLAAR